MVKLDAADFLTVERNLTAERRLAFSATHWGVPSCTRRIPRPTNLHRLWRVLTPLLLRRRKADCGESIVPITHHQYRVEMSGAERTAYRAAVLDPAQDITAKLQTLRLAASLSTAKLAAARDLLRQLVDAGEQVVVFAPFHATLDAFAAVLEEAGFQKSEVRSQKSEAKPGAERTIAILDGRVSPARRAALSRAFRGLAQSKIKNQKSKIDVVLCSQEACAKGNNWPNASHCIVLADVWAFDNADQAPDRIHRLDSPRPVHVHHFLSAGTVDETMADQYAMKGGGSDAVIDGYLGGERPDTEATAADLVASEELRSRTQDSLLACNGGFGVLLVSR